MTPKLTLVIANKNYSSWSMRPWVLLRQAGIPFEEVQLEFEQDNRVVGVEAYSPTRQWISAARRETGFVAADEPYADPR
jgi:hypothetical protein